MDPGRFIHYLTSLKSYQEQIAHVQHLKPREARPGKLDKPLHPRLEACLGELDISGLYSHQAEAINLVSAGHNVIVVTPAASGKTLCYNLPVVDGLLNDTTARALYIFPTKALAQDQWRSLTALACPELLSRDDCGIFDGDTPERERAHIRRRSRIVFTNPDMLHVGILPNHNLWSQMLRHLKFVVIDEAHIYRGIFGSHVANVLRRLRRLCRFYGSNPQFICCSATIANSRELAEKLVGEEFEVTDKDGSPRGEKFFVLWNPPNVDQRRVRRRSANSEASLLLAELVKQGITSLLFARTRQLAELMYVYTRDRLSPAQARKVKPYHAGYLAEERRQIEQALFSGELLAVIATTALELGIDIGDLDATVLCGYPGSLASTWQQAGRSGRRGGTSLSFLIAHNDPLDQFLMRHPEFIFERSFESAMINPGNEHVAMPHLLCAAWEKPLGATDQDFFGDDLPVLLALLEMTGKLRHSGERWFLSPRIFYPAQEVSIRSGTNRGYQLIDVSRGCVLETVDSAVALSQLHPGAIHLHQGEPYTVKELDLEKRIAMAVPMDIPYYTQAREITEIDILKLLKEEAYGQAKVHVGSVEVTTQVVGFRKKMQFSEEVIADEPVDLPAQHFTTEAMWFSLPRKSELQMAQAGRDFPGGLHAVEHGMIGLLPLFALCDRNDIGGSSTPLHYQTGKPEVFIYDAHEGGVGIARRGFEIVEQLWQATLKALQECPCQEGCPACVQSPKCGNSNDPLDKQAAIMLLEGLVNQGRLQSPDPKL
ncbi:MAG: DEAD/DEAH box helicase [Chloroflexota bacterium]